MTWPHPDATALDRARAIARGYRDALHAANPQRAGILDAAAQRVGESWITGATTGERACTVAEAALLLGVTDRRVRQLIASGAIRSEGKTSDGHVLFVAEVLRYQADARRIAEPAISALPSATSGRSVSGGQR